MAAFVHELFGRTKGLPSPPFPDGTIYEEMSGISGSRQHALLEENTERSSASFVKKNAGLSTRGRGPTRPPEKALEG